MPAEIQVELAMNLITAAAERYTAVVFDLADTPLSAGFNWAIRLRANIKVCVCHWNASGEPRNSPSLDEIELQFSRFASPVRDHAALTVLAARVSGLPQPKLYEMPLTMMSHRVQSWFRSPDNISPSDIRELRLAMLPLDESWLRFNKYCSEWLLARNNAGLAVPSVPAVSNNSLISVPCLWGAQPDTDHLRLLRAYYQAAWLHIHRRIR